jgi:hypothetical protein
MPNPSQSRRSYQIELPEDLSSSVVVPWFQDHLPYPSSFIKANSFFEDISPVRPQMAIHFSYQFNNNLSPIQEKLFWKKEMVSTFQYALLYGFFKQALNEPKNMNVQKLSNEMEQINGALVYYRTLASLTVAKQIHSPINRSPENYFGWIPPNIIVSYYEREILERECKIEEIKRYQEQQDKKPYPMLLKYFEPKRVFDKDGFNQALYNIQNPQFRSDILKVSNLIFSAQTYGAIRLTQRGNFAGVLKPYRRATYALIFSFLAAWLMAVLIGFLRKPNLPT